MTRGATTRCRNQFWVQTEVLKVPPPVFRPTQPSCSGPKTGPPVVPSGALGGATWSRMAGPLPTNVPSAAICGLL
jgi:hypothetical protein